MGAGKEGERELKKIEETSWPTVKEEEMDLDFHEQFRRLPGGEQIRSCIQCGTCSGSCPVAKAMDHTPRQIIAMIRAGMKDEVLQSNTPFYCASCFSCAVRCPRDISITEVMYNVKTISELTASKVFYDVFTDLVLRYGRLHEGELLVRSALKTNVFDLFGYAPVGLQMLLKGKVAFLPHRISGQQEMRKMYEYAQEVREEG